MLYREAVELCKKAGWWKDLVKKNQEDEAAFDDIIYHRSYYDSLERGDAGPYKKHAPLDIEEVYDPDTFKTISEKPVTGKYKVNKATLKLIAAAIEADRKEGIKSGWLQPSDAKRKLYLHSIRRLRGSDEQPSDNPELYLDIRDKGDPKFRYSDAVDHEITWYNGSNGLVYNG